MPDCGICRKSAKPSPTAGCDFCGEGKFVIEWGELAEDIRAAKARAEAGKATDVHVAADEILQHPGTLELTLEQARFLNDLPWNIWPFCDLTSYANCAHCEYWHEAAAEAEPEQPAEAETLMERRKQWGLDCVRVGDLG